MCVRDVSRPSRGQVMSPRLLDTMTSSGPGRVLLPWWVLREGARGSACSVSLHRLWPLQLLSDICWNFVGGRPKPGRCRACHLDTRVLSTGVQLSVLHGWLWTSQTCTHPKFPLLYASSDSIFVSLSLALLRVSFGGWQCTY